MDFDNFDIHADKYEDTLNKSLEFTGADGSYYAERKIQSLHNFYKDNGLDYPQNILEFGCGTGNNLDQCSLYFKNSLLHGIDISSKSTDITRERNICNCIVKHCNINEIPYDDSYFDLVIISNVFHHIDYELHEKTLSLIRSKVKRGGIIAIFEHNPINPFTVKFVKDCPLDIDVRLLKHTYTKTILQSLGFKILSTRFITFLPPFFARFNYIENYLTRIALGAQYGVFAIK